MADYSKFKNVNGDDLVLQDSRVDAISEKVEGIETGAEVNKVESISIEGTEFVPDENKCINIGLYSGTGGLAWDEGLYIPTQKPLYRGTSEHPGIYFGYDNSTLELNDDDVLSVKNPVPDTDAANDGDVLTYNATSDEIVWAAPQPCKIPEYTQSDAGKVLAVKADGSGLEWISLAPANSVGVNNEPVGVNGDYFTVGEGQ